MYRGKERRKEQRLQCDWSVWFAEDFKKPLFFARMHDLTSTAVSFVCPDDKHLPDIGHEVIVYFYVPALGRNDMFDRVCLKRTGHIYRIEDLKASRCKMIVQFHVPLSFKPFRLEAVNKMLSAEMAEEIIASERITWDVAEEATEPVPINSN